MTVTATYSLHVDWDNDGLFDDGEMVGDIVDVTIERGFSTPLARMAFTGRATFTVQNVDQSYSPLLNSGQVPMRQVRFRMTFDGVTRTLFRGYLYNIQPISTGGGPPKRVALHCVDAIALMDLREAAIAIQLNANAKTILTALVNAVYTPPAGVNMQNGINVFPVSADRWSMGSPVGVRWYASHSRPTETEVRASSKIVDVCASDWGRFFVDGQGRPTYVNRHDQLLDTTPRLTMVNTMHGMGYQRHAEDIVNVVDVTYAPRVVGDVNEVLGTLSQGSAVKLESGETQTFTLRYRDPSNPALDVGAYALEGLVAYTDYRATDDEEGEGLDKTGFVTLMMTLSGGSEVQIEATNTDAGAIYLQRLQVRGKAVRTRREETARALDPNSIDEYEHRHLPVSAPLMSSRSQAQLLANHLLALYGAPTERIQGIRIYANQSETFMGAVRDLELLEPIRVTESHLGLSDYDGIVYQMTHNIRHPEFHEVVAAIQAPYEVAGTPVQLDTTTFASGHVLVY